MSCDPSSQARYAGRTVFITGAAGNFGSCLAKRMLCEGANIVLCDLFADKLNALKTTLVESVPCGEERILVADFDVCDESAVQAGVQKAVDTFGQIDFCFNNAGYQGLFTAVDKYVSADFAKVIAVNVTGVFHVLKTVAAHMKAKGVHGSIVNTASKAGVDGCLNMPAYSASKAAVIGLTKTASKDLASANIRVNAISPAYIGPEDGFMWIRQTELQAAAGSQYYETDPKDVAKNMIGQVPLRRIGKVEEIVGVVAFLFSSDAGYLTGTNTEITGGI